MGLQNHKRAKLAIPAIHTHTHICDYKSGLKSHLVELKLSSTLFFGTGPGNSRLPKNEAQATMRQAQLRKGMHNVESAP